MASARTQSPGAENMPTGKPIMRAMSEGVQRRALSELNTNAKVAPTPDSRGAKSTTTSPLKRRIGNVLDDDKGLKYLKRRRTSHTPVMGTVHLHTAATRKRDNVEKAQANKETARFRPLPQSTRSRDNRVGGRRLSATCWSLASDRDASPRYTTANPRSPKPNPRAKKVAADRRNPLRPKLPSRR